MILLQPLWMGALLPWAALSVYVLRRGRSRAASVPFLKLWGADRVSDRSVKPRKVDWPLSVLLGLVAMLVAIFAAADPARSGAVHAVTVIVDRGLTMSLRGTAAELVSAVDQRVHSERVHLELVPGLSIDTNGSHWAALARQAGPTAVDTADSVRQAAATALALDGTPVIVISDASIPSDPHLVQISPAGPLTNAGIERLAVTGGAAPQAMVRLHGSLATRSGRLTITGGAKAVSAVVGLPPAGATVDLFVDLPSPIGDTVTATLVAGHTSPMNDHAAVVRSPGGPLRWTAAGPVPAVIGRIIDVYSRLRPADDASFRAVVRMEPVDHDGNGLWLVPEQRGSVGAILPPFISPARLTAGVRDWPAPADRSAIAPAGWRTLVRRGDVPILAERSDDRAIWLNGELDPWARSPSFVVFFAGAFDAVADGSAEWSEQSPHPLEPDWSAEEKVPAGTAPGEWPGIYTNGSRRVAINAGPIDRGGQSSAEDDLSKLDRLSSASTAGAGSMRPYLAAAAAIATVLALSLRNAGR